LKVIFHNTSPYLLSPLQLLQTFPRTREEELC
jgi:hypothetical protein